MKTRRIVATALVLAAGLAPGLAQATCSGMSHSSASRCETGQTWDAAQERCVTPTNS